MIMDKNLWKPVLSGDVYCSPGCGHRCKKSEFDAINALAAKVLGSVKTKGWRIEVCENLGWFWCLKNDLCGLSLHYAPGRHSHKFYCLLAGKDEYNCSHGDASFELGAYEDPNEAINESVKIATPVYEAWQRGLENLKSINL